MKLPHAVPSCSSVEPLRGSRNPQDYLNAITAAYPCPALSGFERAHWLYQTREAVRWIVEFTDTEFRRQIADISDREITSDRYKIIPKKRQESHVKLKSLREKYPDVFEELVYLKASDAQKILGRRTVYTLARAKVGEAALRQYEAVNVGDLEKVLTPEQATGLIETFTRITDWAVVEVEQ